jgi:hypothetical protein
VADVAMRVLTRSLIVDGAFASGYRIEQDWPPTVYSPDMFQACVLRQTTTTPVAGGGAESSPWVAIPARSVLLALVRDDAVAAEAIARVEGKREATGVVLDLPPWQARGVLLFDHGQPEPCDDALWLFDQRVYALKDVHVSGPADEQHAALAFVHAFAGLEAIRPV